MGRSGMACVRQKNQRELCSGLQIPVPIDLIWPILSMFSTPNISTMAASTSVMQAKGVTARRTQSRTKPIPEATIVPSFEGQPNCRSQWGNSPHLAHGTIYKVPGGRQCPCAWTVCFHGTGQFLTRHLAELDSYFVIVEIFLTLRNAALAEDFGYNATRFNAG
jgi:hypothetical protein